MDRRLIIQQILEGERTVAEVREARRLLLWFCQPDDPDDNTIGTMFRMYQEPREITYKEFNDMDAPGRILIAVPGGRKGADRLREML